MQIRFDNNSVFSLCVPGEGGVMMHFNQGSLSLHTPDSYLLITFTWSEIFRVRHVVMLLGALHWHLFTYCTYFLN